MIDQQRRAELMRMCEEALTYPSLWFYHTGGPEIARALREMLAEPMPQAVNVKFGEVIYAEPSLSTERVGEKERAARDWYDSLAWKADRLSGLALQGYRHVGALLAPAKPPEGE